LHHGGMGEVGGSCHDGEHGGFGEQHVGGDGTAEVNESERWDEMSGMSMGGCLAKRGGWGGGRSG
jgi:hypothetical protein